MWRVCLLETIEATGSISAAARQLGVPYRTAWQKIHEIEQRLGVRVLETAAGGQRGGGATLTRAARRAIEEFHSFSQGFEEEVVQRFEKTCEGL